MRADFNLLPRSPHALDLQPRLVAINGQVGQLIQGFELDSLLQIVAFERAAIDAEFELQEPRFAGDGMKEPAVTLLRRADLDDAAFAPVGFGKIAQHLNAIDDL